MPRGVRTRKPSRELIGIELTDPSLYCLTLWISFYPIMLEPTGKCRSIHRLDCSLITRLLEPLVQTLDQCRIRSPPFGEKARSPSPKSLWLHEIWVPCSGTGTRPEEAA